MDRRQFLQTGGLACLVSALPASAAAAPLALTARPSQTNIVGPDFPSTDVWSFNGKVPGLPIRVMRGQELNIEVNNALAVPTSVHWHGIRLPNAMDGVAGLTQVAILPGKKFLYSFSPPDSGTYWYHSHFNAYEQVGRGLYGPLIVEEPDPPTVDRDLIWMLDDWRLLDDASISDDFGAGHDRSHAGRIGNVPTVNGRFRDIVKVRTGERLRLRLINAANARTFALTLDGLNPKIIAIDGQAIKPYQPDGPIVIGAASRVDVIVDMTGDPGTKSSVVDTAYREAFNLTRFVYDDLPLRETALTSAIALAPPAIPEPELEGATSLDVVIRGGAMGGLKRAMLDGQWKGMREIAQQGYVWAINDTVANKLKMPPLLEVSKGTSVKLTLENQTAFSHPMHLHGHHMKLLTVNDNPVSEARWVDTPLLQPNQRMELAFVADNPGDWLLHCHALEHHAAGLGALVRVN